MIMSSNLGKRKHALLVTFLFLFAAYCMADTVTRRSPVPLGLSIVEEAQFPTADLDIIGCRLCLLYGRHANMSGFDIGVFGCALDGCLLGFQTSAFMNSVGSGDGALQICGIINYCIEDFYGAQIVGLVNKTDCSIFGGQIGSLNIAEELGGIQIGVYNKTVNGLGVQIGVLNWATTMKGIQLGALNIIEKSHCQCLPVLNANF